MVNGSWEATIGLRRQVSSQRRQRLVQITAWIVGELDSDRFSGSLGRGTIQRLDGTLSLRPLVEPDEADPF